MALSLLASALLQPVEFAINRLIARDPHILRVLNTAAAGKTIAVSCTSTPRWQVSLTLHHDRIMLLSAPQDHPDASLRGSHRALSRLLFSDDQGTALHDPDIELSGDVQLIQRLHRALADLDINWQDLLGPVLGDIGTQAAATGWQHGRDTITQAAGALKRDITDFVQEEAGLAPTRQQAQHFTEELDALRLRLDRLQARIQHLQQLVTN
jgi:ubiquinone biosynthesis protein UbiJ